MPISSQTPIIGYVANGVTKSFAFPFVILSADDLKVKVGADVVTAGFSITGVGDRDGGSVTFAEAPASLTPIILYREVTLDRAIDYQENGDLLAVVLDDDFDRIWMAMQDQSVLASRVLRSPIGETLPQLPAASERALSALAFDEEGNPIVVRGTDGNVTVFVRDLASTAAGKGAGLVGFKQSATGAVGRTVNDKLGEVVSVKDFGQVTTDAAIAAANAAVSASGGGVLKWPAGSYSYTFTPPPYGVVWDMDGPDITRQQLGGSGAGVRFQTAKLSYIDGPHTTSQVQTHHIRTIAKGSGAIGAQCADYVMGLTVEKQNWSSAATAEPGEIDGLTIFLRNGGPNTGDNPSISGGAAILANVGQIDQSGATQVLEAVSNVFDRADPNTTIRQINVQVGMCNTRDSDYYGLILNSNIGSQDSALRVTCTTANPWNRCLELRKDSVDRLVIGDTGSHRYRTASGSIDMTFDQDASGNLTFRNTSGTLVMNVPQSPTNTQTSTAYTLVESDHGKLIVAGNNSAITLTLPNGLGVGFRCRVLQRDIGQVTCVAAGAIAVRNVNGHTKTKGQYAIIDLIVAGTSGANSVWYLSGDTAA